MKAYMETSIDGGGYTRKEFDTTTRQEGGDGLKGEKRTLYMRSKARLLLASVGSGRFGKRYEGAEAASVPEIGTASKPLEDLNVFFYCPSPSIGWSIKQIDANTGAAISEGQNARASLSRESIALLDNYGCTMALFRSGSRQCFMVKEVKSDSVNPYGQNKTVTFMVESAKSRRTVRQLAALALLDYPTFKRRLLDCVKITASTIGFTVHGEKLRELVEPVNVRVRPAEGDARRAAWDEIVAPPSPSQPYSLLLLEISLDYFNNSTGLGVRRNQIRRICDETDISGDRPAMALVPDMRADSATAPEKNLPTGKSARSIDAAPQRDTQKDEHRTGLLKHPLFKAFVIFILVGILSIAGIWFARNGQKDSAPFKDAVALVAVEAEQPADVEQ